MKEISEAFTKLLTVGYLLFFALGGLVVLRYCLSIDYYPSGVGIGDSLFFISAAIMFFVVYGFYFGLIYGSSLLIISIIRVPFNRVSSFVKVRFNKSALQATDFALAEVGIAVAGSRREHSEGDYAIRTGGQAMRASGRLEADGRLTVILDGTQRRFSSTPSINTYCEQYDLRSPAPGLNLCKICTT